MCYRWHETFRTLSLIITSPPAERLSPAERKGPILSTYFTSGGNGTLERHYAKW